MTDFSIDGAAEEGNDRRMYQPVFNYIIAYVY